MLGRTTLSLQLLKVQPCVLMWRALLGVLLGEAVLECVYELQ